MAGQQGPSSSSVEYAEVRRLLDQACIQCHGTSRQEGGLRLDSAPGLQRGSDHGSILEHQADSPSRLLLAIRGKLRGTQQMPAEGPALTENQMELLTRWVKAGTPMPANEVEAAVESDHWAFRPIKRPPVPEVDASARRLNPIDHFILKRLDEQQLTPSPPADKATVARRVALDLTGIPLSPEAWNRYMSDPSPRAYEQLVDQLLASPHYGERWGRHWLDQARYADSNGFTRDFARQIWKYRDWVINAINQDMPFDQFTIEQIAGDMLPDASLDQLVATGFHRNTLFNEEGGTDPEQFRVDAVADRVATTGAVFLGLTLGCARCHPHKYDPISQREYYEMFALLNNCDEPEIDAPSYLQRMTGELARRDRIRNRIQQLDQELDALGETFLKAQYAWEETITPEFRAKLPGPVQASLDLEASERDESQRQLVKDLFKQSKAAEKQFEAVAEITRLKMQEPVIPTSLVLKEREDRRPTHVHRRGNFLDHGPLVTPGTPGILPSIQSPQTAPTRLDFARWLVDKKNPLTARVTVNRIWQRFFGRGIVATENDFGTQGDSPTHPDLLDWLASEFMAKNWNTKALHRLIVTSATYRQSAYFRPELKRRDPGNFWLARQSRLRLDAEIIRDSAITVAGQLAPIIGGPSVYPPQPDGVFEFTQDPKPWPTASGDDRFRRALYTHLWRSSPYPALVVFDAPDGNVTCTQRNRSNTPMQALTLANDIQFLEAARAVAEAVLTETDSSTDSIADALFVRCLSRTPTPAEAQFFRQLLTSEAEREQRDEASQKAFVGETLWHGRADRQLAYATVFAARVLLNTDEFITRE